MGWWMYLLLIFAAAVALARIVFAIRRTRSQPRNDWDAQMVRNLRARGGQCIHALRGGFFLQSAGRGCLHGVAPHTRAGGFHDRRA